MDGPRKQVRGYEARTEGGRRKCVNPAVTPPEVTYLRSKARVTYKEGKSGQVERTYLGADLMRGSEEAWGAGCYSRGMADRTI